MSWLENLGQVLRFHQWPKNLLLFIPVISGHELGNVEIMGRAVLGMLAFCFCAASVYVMNDLHDLETDRAHPAKRMRPFAAGTVPLGVGLTLAPALVLLAALGALFLPLMFGVYLGIYWTVATVYSWRLKEIVLLDVFILAGLYTIRVLAGHGASGIGYSNWLLGFAMFLFLSLALVKRYVEVHRIERGSGTHVAGRGYQAGDSSIIAALGLATGSLSALVLALYINSAEVRLLYSQPWVLFFICPLLLYWISRVWLLAYRGRLHDDPVVFALKDKGSYGAGALAAVFVWLASVL